MTLLSTRTSRSIDTRVWTLANRLLQFGIVTGLVAGIRRRDPSVIVNGVISLAFVSLPQYVERRYDVTVRPWQRGWISTSALVHTIGMLGPYDRVWWWDHLAHTLSSVVVAGAADVLYQSESNSELPSRSRPAFVAGVTFGLGFVWELFEYVVHRVGDRIGFEPLLVHYGRLDAIGDLVFDLFGAAIVVQFGRDKAAKIIDSRATSSEAVDATRSR
ncbi:hypothetical protein [Halopiger goleimassiliensis]|uniref:hypothetical protein n=1 Tax=Halopiger goleimassiliensis TaxID=1293048 RepID=UPI0006782D76|nr:hypothetical protein [Halopiger goleimassiliensis]